MYILGKFHPFSYLQPAPQERNHMNIKTILFKEKFFILILLMALTYEVYFMVDHHLPFNLTNTSLTLSSFSIVICIVFVISTATLFRLATTTLFICTFLLGLVAAELTDNLRLELVVNMIVGIICSAIGIFFILCHLFYKTTKHTLKRSKPI